MDATFSRRCDWASWLHKRGGWFFGPHRLEEALRLGEHGTFPWPSVKRDDKMRIASCFLDRSISTLVGDSVEDYFGGYGGDFEWHLYFEYHAKRAWPETKCPNVRSALLWLEHTHGKRWSLSWLDLAWQPGAACAAGPWHDCWTRLDFWEQMLLRQSLNLRRCFVERHGWREDEDEEMMFRSEVEEVMMAAAVYGRLSGDYAWLRNAAARSFPRHPRLHVPPFLDDRTLVEWHRERRLSWPDLEVAPLAYQFRKVQLKSCLTHKVVGRCYRICQMSSHSDYRGSHPDVLMDAWRDMRPAHLPPAKFLWFTKSSYKQWKRSLRAGTHTIPANELLDPLGQCRVAPWHLNGQAVQGNREGLHSEH